MQVQYYRNNLYVIFIFKSSRTATAQLRKKFLKGEGTTIRTTFGKQHGMESHKRLRFNNNELLSSLYGHLYMQVISRYIIEITRNPYHQCQKNQTNHPADRLQDIHRHGFDCSTLSSYPAGISLPQHIRHEVD